MSNRLKKKITEQDFYRYKWKKMTSARVLSLKNAPKLFSFKFLAFFSQKKSQVVIPKDRGTNIKYCNSMQIYVEYK
jgi:hypothetical protein